MNRFVKVPADRLDPQTLRSLLEDYATRDGTDYGAREADLEEKVSSLLEALDNGSLQLLWDSKTEQWDLLTPERIAPLSLE